MKLRVGLEDNTFRGDPGSVRGATPAYIEYVRDVLAFDGPHLFTDGFTTDAEAATRDAATGDPKIGWLHEPPCLIPTVYEAAAANLRHFDRMLTYDAGLLKLPGFQFCPYGGVWIDPAERGLRPKTRLVSMLIGSKSATPGHRIRPRIADFLDLHGLRVDYYGVRGQAVDYSAATKLKVLGDYAFSIVGECCRVDNLFTEILLDCFAVGTIPIFWGCPNIGKYFDELGILSFESPQQCAELVAALRLSSYQHFLPHARENLARSAQFAVTDDWLYEHVLKVYDRETAGA